MNVWYINSILGAICLEEENAPFVEAILILSARFRTIFSKTAIT